MTQATGDVIYGLAEVAAIINRSVGSARKYATYEGLPHTKKYGRILVSKADLDEWRSRPEVQDMLRTGDRLHSLSRHAAAV